MVNLIQTYHFRSFIPECLQKRLLKVFHYADEWSKKHSVFMLYDTAAHYFGLGSQEACLRYL